MFRFRQRVKGGHAVGKIEPHQLKETIATMLIESCRKDFTGTASVEIAVADGTITQIRKTSSQDFL